MRLRCPECSTTVDVIPGREAKCPQCGFTAPAPPPTEPHFLPDPDASVELRSEPTFIPYEPPPDLGPLTWGHVVGGLLLNLVLPGAGTLLVRRRLEGWLQLGLFVLGLATLLWLIGLALVPAAWVWALVTSIQEVAAGPEPRPRASRQ